MKLLKISRSTWGLLRTRPNAIVRVATVAWSVIVVDACTPSNVPPLRQPSLGTMHNCSQPTLWARGQVFYEVFVRSFSDSNGDGKGDLRGLIDHLDYLNDGDAKTLSDLGIDGIWLMPIFPSPSYHGYDVIDFTSINTDYGTISDFDELCREAHRRGIRVIIDWVANHTSSKHPWFVDAASSEHSSHRNWYVWRPTDPGWTQPWSDHRTWHPLGSAYYYGLFEAGMPDLNFRSVDVRVELEKLAMSWLRRGADGFRLDASRYLVEDGANPLQADTGETHAYWKEFAATLHSSFPDAMLVGENTTTTDSIAHYFGSTKEVSTGDELTTSFNFPLAQSIIESLKTGCSRDVMRTLQAMMRTYPPAAIDAPFLTNHDQIRLATQLDQSSQKLRSAAAILLTLPGVSFLYYGEELGMQNGGMGPADELKRTPFPWNGGAHGGFSSASPWRPLAPGFETANVAFESADPSSMLAWYKGWIRTRKGSEALRLGELRLNPSSNSGCSPVLMFTRDAQTERALVVHNLGNSDEVVKGIDIDSWGCLRCASGARLEQQGGHVSAFVPAGTSSVWVAPKKQSRTNRMSGAK